MQWMLSRWRSYTGLYKYGNDLTVALTGVDV